MLGKIKDHIKNEIYNKVPVTFNSIIAKTEGILNIQNMINLDWSLMFPSGVKNDILYFPINGQFFKHQVHSGKPIVKANPSVQVKSAPKELKEHIGLLISNYSLASLAKQQFIGLVGKTNSSDLPEDDDIQLDTSSLDFFLPGMAEKYGDDVPVEVSYKVLDVSDIFINGTNESVSSKVDLQMQFVVKGDVAIDLTLEKMNVVTHIHTWTGTLDGLELLGSDEVMNMTSFQLHVGSLKLNSLKLTSSKIGEIDIVYFNDFLRDFIKLAQP